MGRVLDCLYGFMVSGVGGATSSHGETRADWLALTPGRVVLRIFDFSGYNSLWLLAGYPNFDFDDFVASFD